LVVGEIVEEPPGARLEAAKTEGRRAARGADRGRAGWVRLPELGEEIGDLVLRRRGEECLGDLAAIVGVEIFGSTE